MLIFVICYIISKEEDIPAHFSAEVFCATAFDKFVDDATQCILGCTRRASRAALLCGGAQPARRVCNRVENRTYRVVTRVVSRVIIERTPALWAKVIICYVYAYKYGTNTVLTLVQNFA